MNANNFVALAHETIHCDYIARNEKMPRNLFDKYVYVCWPIRSQECP